VKALKIRLTGDAMPCWVLILVLFTSPAFADKEKGGDKKEEPKAPPSLGELLTVNGKLMFGTKVVWDDAAGTVSFNVATPKVFEELFEGDGIAGPGDLPPGLRRMMMKHPTEKGDIKSVPVVGYHAGNWRFKYDRFTDYTIKFEIRPYDLAARSELAIVTNRARRKGEKKDSYIRTAFLQGHAIPFENGKKVKKRKVTTQGEFKGPASARFGSEAMTSVTLTYANGLFTVKLGKDKHFLEFQADDFPGGSWGVQFRKFSFVMSNLSVSAKFDRDWLEAELDALKEKGELRLPKGYEHVAKKDDERKAKERRKREAEIEL
jgi:hypothetical protein